MSEQEKLLPCGCGGDRRTYDCGVTGKGYVECDCGMEIWAKNKPEARKAWNRAMTRPQPAIEGDVVDRVAEAIRKAVYPSRPFSQVESVKCSRAAIAAMQPTIDKAVAEERARCVGVCRLEKVDAHETDDECDFSYNRAIDDCINAIEQGGGDA